MGRVVPSAAARAMTSAIVFCDEPSIRRRNAVQVAI
jgi:hypothetical protein